MRPPFSVGRGQGCWPGSLAACPRRCLCPWVVPAACASSARAPAGSFLLAPGPRLCTSLLHAWELVSLANRISRQPRPSSSPDTHGGGPEPTSRPQRRAWGLRDTAHSPTSHGCGSAPRPPAPPGVSPKSEHPRRPDSRSQPYPACVLLERAPAGVRHPHPRAQTAWPWPRSTHRAPTEQDP